MAQLLPLRVSVVLCTYNGARYVAEQLASILAQTHPPSEVIVSDDGSSDGTLEIVARLTKSSQIPVRIIRNPVRLGYSDNFLTACRLANGDAIALSDQDDLWSPTKLERQLRALRRTGAAMCAHDIDYMDSRGHATGGRTRRWSHRSRLIDPLRASPWGNYKGFTVMFQSRLLDLIPAEQRGLDTHVEGDRLPHDRWLYFLATTFGSTVFLSERLARYRQHDTQLYGGTYSRSLGERLKVKVRAGEQQSRYLASVTGHRAQILTTYAPQPPPLDWVKAGLRWHGLQSHLMASLRIYESESLLRRYLIVVQNLRHRVYAPFRFGGLGLERLAEDLLVSTALGLSKKWTSDEVLLT